MKKLLILLLISQQIFATDYYVTSGGNNTTGLSPANGWQNITKLNASLSSVNAGDRVLFNRGETFYGQINLVKSGTPGNLVTLTAYGTGAKPVITGFTTITSGWTNEGGGIYSKVITSSALTNMVTIDGVQYGMGRYPDATYLTYQSFSTNVSITSSSLSGTPNYTGAEVVIRKSDWIIDRNTVTSQSTGTLNYTSLGYGSSGTNNYGFFLQNFLGSLTTFGEWYHDFAGTGKFYMYFGGVTPTTKTINVATSNSCVTNAGFDYLTIDNINFQGTISDAISFTGTTDNITVQNCDIIYAGKRGINFSAGANTSITGNTITYCNHSGINTDASTDIGSNVISFIDLIVGQYLGAGGASSGVRIVGNTSNVHNNTIKNVGYNGVTIVTGGVSTVQYNFIDSTLTTMDDGGGIYVSANSATVRLIDHNIINNVIGNLSGTTRSTSLTGGIYLDEDASNCQVTNNTIANCPNAGIKVHVSNTNTLTDNFTYNCLYGLRSQDDGSSRISSMSLRRNIFFAKTSTQYPVYISTIANNLTTFGTFDSNYYCRPINELLAMWRYQTSNGEVTENLPEWVTFTGQDANSKKAPKTIAATSELNFQYNATGSPSVYNFPGYKKMITSGLNVNNGITIPAWSSVILFDNGFSPPINYIINGIW